MPTRPLPKDLIERLEKAEPKHSEKLWRMKNADHRLAFHPLRNSLPARETDFWGTRARLIEVSDSYPGISVVLKRDRTPLKTVTLVKNTVKKHNETYKPKLYRLLEPHAYPLPSQLIAMAKTDKPSLEEILGSDLDPKNDGQTARGRAFFEKLQKRHAISEERLKKAYAELRNAADEMPNFAEGLIPKTITRPDHILVIGFRNGKFAFMPLVDWI